MKDSPFLLWLNSSCLPEDLLPLPWDKEILYMPISSARDKFDIMQTQFNATVMQIDVSANATITHDKDTLVWACVKFIVYHEDFINGSMTVCGTASFLKGQYKGWAFTQIAESLATTRAFGKIWKQFGRDLNKELDSVKNLNSPDGKRNNSSAVKDTMKNIA